MIILLILYALVGAISYYTYSFFKNQIEFNGFLGQMAKEER